MQNRKDLQIIIENEVSLFPSMIAPIFIEDNNSYDIKNIKEKGEIFLVNSKENFEGFRDFSTINNLGLVASVIRKVKIGDERYKLLIQGLYKAKIVEELSYFPFRAEVEEVFMEEISPEKEQALSNILKETFKEISPFISNLNPDLINVIEKHSKLDKLCDTIISAISLNKTLAYSFFEELNLEEKAKKLINFLENSLQAAKVEKEIRKLVKIKLDKNNKEFFLKEQLKQIHQELGENNNRDEEIEEFKEKLEAKKKYLYEDAYKEIKKQIDKLARLHPDSVDSSVTQNYLEWALELPYEKISNKRLSVEQVAKQLNKDHFALEKVKERIEEYFALKQLLELRGADKKESSSFILCFVGPPGVGKTSIANSISKALKRSLVRMALGGLDDVNELRGHRRTYVGSMPGRIVQALIEAKEMNPVIVLDEIDKLNKNYKGDPSAALLEILDPEQNNKFRDYYLNFNIDLTKVIFIATANDISSIPAPLRDRMEFIYLSSYTPQEKYEIAKNFLLPQELKKHALKASEVSISSGALKKIIEEYTRESGVRNLRRKIADILRKSAVQILKDGVKKISINEKNLKDFLDKKVYELDEIQKDEKCGIVNGLAWTAVGGDLLKVEAIKIKAENKANLFLTGQLGDVMKESAQLAYSLVKVMIDEGKIKAKKEGDKALYNLYDIHLHVPQGATPKDGPSAGITMATAIASILTEKPAKYDLAMTGELTLSGKVLAIGGLKEKLIAAYKAKVKTVLIPRKNFEQDLEDIPEEVKKGLRILPVDRIEDVFKVAF